MDTSAVSCGTDIPKFKGVAVGTVPWIMWMENL